MTLLRMGNANYELGDVDAARGLFERLIREHGNSEPARLASRKLQELK